MSESPAPSPSPHPSDQPSCFTCFDIRNWYHNPSVKSTAFPGVGYSAGSGSYFVIHQHLEVLVASQSTCPKCAIIVKALATVGLPVHQDHVKLTLRVQKGEPVLVEYCAPNTGEGDPVVSHWELYRLLRTPYTAKDPASEGPSIGYAPIVSRILRAKTAAERAKMWLETCHQSHHAYQEHWAARRSVLPTRVVQVAPENGMPRLHIPGRGDTADYVTLSYCWGNALTTTTTTANLHERTQGIH